MTKNQKIGWGIGAAVVVIALIAFSLMHDKASAPTAGDDTAASSTAAGMASTSPIGAASSTNAGNPGAPSVASHTAAPAQPATPKPVTVSVPLGKTIVDHASGIGLTLNDVDVQTKESGATSLVAKYSVNTNVCTPSTGCVARQDTKKNFQGSAPYGFNYGSYFVQLEAVTQSGATFTISKASPL